MQSIYFKSLNHDDLYHNIETYVLNNQVQCVIFFAWFVTFLNAVLSSSNQSSKIHKLEDRLSQYGEESKYLTCVNIELNNEVKDLTSKVKSLTVQLEHSQTENVTLTKTIKKLNERNQTLCESLGDFIRYKKRKLDTSDVIDELPHNYNLRNRKNINYFGLDSNNHEADSDYEEALKK